MLCDSCHKREATSRLIKIGEVHKTANLCDECFRLATGALATAQQRNARCEYCGGQPCAGGTDFLALVTGVQKLKFMCMPCSMEHNRYVRQQLQQDASGLSQQEQLVLLRKLDEEANKHMKQWVSERGSQ